MHNHSQLSDIAISSIAILAKHDTVGKEKLLRSPFKIIAQISQKYSQLHSMIHHREKRLKKCEILLHLKESSLLIIELQFNGPL